MTEHLPECRLGEPCDIDIAEHGFCSMQVEEQFFCIHCMGECICERLRCCEQRTIAAAAQRVAALPEYKLRDTCVAAIKGEQND
jgi:hypothetical protein